jgi:cytosine/adenosine deaminase-related metal-dependent hydrolase
MDTERVLPNQNVVICGDRIAAIGAADELSVPRQLAVIDGEGKYLVPGLVDVHVHWSPPAHHIDDGWLFLRPSNKTIGTRIGSI